MASDAVQATGPDAESFTWIGGASGSWNDVSNWATGQDLTPATRIPGAQDSVSISSATVGGSGTCSDLTVVGVTLTGDFRTDAFTDGSFDAPSASTVSGGGSLECSSARLDESKLVASGTGSAIIVDGAVQTAVLEGVNELLASDGGLFQIGSFGSTQSTNFGTDSASSFEIGHAGGAPAGVVTIDPGTVYSVGFANPNAVSTILDDGVINTQPGSSTDLDTPIIGTGAIQISPGSVIDLEQPVGPDLSIQFMGSMGGAALIAADQLAQPRILDFQPGDAVSFEQGTIGATYRIDGTTSATVTLDLSDGGTDDVTFLGDYSGERFDYDNGTVTLVPCFCPGTLIMTPHGERPVEALAIGDAVCTASGEMKPILWIGRRSYGRRFAAARKDLQPIRIRQGALGDGRPGRDLLVSPRHAMLVGDVLVPAGLLVNDRSIIQEDQPGDVHYLHIELEDHDLLLAEGAVSESFVDDHSRGMFHNAADYHRLYPGRAATLPGRGLPKVEDGPLLVAACRHIDRIAGLDGSESLPPLRGRVDEATPRIIRGWAWCPAHEHAPVLLDVLVDGMLVEQVLADRFRADLAAAGIGAGCHAFEVAVADVRPGSALAVRRSDDGLLLTGLPQAA